MHHVIIGNGVAGINAAESIRRLGSAGSITMISNETGLPYSRPMISLVLEGVIEPQRLPIRGPDFYDALKIDPLLGETVEKLDVDRRTVSTRSGKTVSYDRLLIASGADPRPIQARGKDLENIFFMRSEKDVRKMLEILPGVRKALVLGGGLVGFKAAYGLLSRGVSVTMLIGSGYPLSLQVDETAGRMILNELESRGLEVRVGVTVEAFDGEKRVKSARLSDGSVHSCDMVVVGKGVLPALSFVPRHTIEVDLGIMVNGRMETSAEHVYAAGDAAEHIDIARKTPWVNAIWPEAASQGAVAGMNMAGRRVNYRGSLSRNVIRIFGLDVMTCGMVKPPQGGGYETHTLVDPRRNTYRKLVFRGGRLVGAVLVNEIEQGGILMSLIRSELPVVIPPERLMDPSFNFGTLTA